MNKPVTLGRRSFVKAAGSLLFVAAAPVVFTRSVWQVPGSAPVRSAQPWAHWDPASVAHAKDVVIAMGGRAIKTRLAYDLAGADMGQPRGPIHRPFVDRETGERLTWMEVQEDVNVWGMGELVPGEDAARRPSVIVYSYDARANANAYVAGS